MLIQFHFLADILESQLHREDPKGLFMFLNLTSSGFLNLQIPDPKPLLIKSSEN